MPTAPHPGRFKGFTLVELMIVIAIIGILATIAIPNYMAYRTGSANVAANAEAKNFLTMSLAQVADSGAAFDYSNDGNPTGFIANADVTIAGNLAIAADGTITSTITFQHANGDQAYSIGNDGAITP